MNITKSKLALSVLVVSLLVPAVALASTVFDDVPDGKFYSEPVQWAFDNGVTTGTSATTFSPDDPVTRGQNVTFMYRHQKQVIDPLLDDIRNNLELQKSISIDHLALAGSDDDVSVDFVTTAGLGSHALVLPIGAAGVTTIIPTIEFGFTVPPDYTPNSPIDVVFKWISEATNCDMALQQNYVNGLAEDGAVAMYDPTESRPSLTIGASNGVLHSTTFTYLIGQDYLDASGDSFEYPDGIYDGAALVPGSAVNLGIFRSPYVSGGDTCRDSGVFGIVGISIHYS